MNFKLANSWISAVTDKNGDYVFDADGNVLLTGCVAEVYEGNATFAIAEIILIEEGFAYGDYVFTYNINWRYRTRLPKPIAPMFNLIKPFNYVTWISLFATLVITMVVFVIFMFLSQHEKKWDVFNNALNIYKHQLYQS